MDQTISDLFVGNPVVYEISAPVTGTLVVRLSWEPRKLDYENAHLMMTIGECAVPKGRGYPACPSAKEFAGPDARNWFSPIVARVSMSNGQTYRVVVDEGVFPWGYGFNQPFSLIASFE